MPAEGEGLTQMHLKRRRSQTHLPRRRTCCISRDDEVRQIYLGADHLVDSCIRVSWSKFNCIGENANVNSPRCRAENDCHLHSAVHRSLKVVGVATRIVVVKS